MQHRPVVRQSHLIGESCAYFLDIVFDQSKLLNAQKIPLGPIGGIGLLCCSARNQRHKVASRVYEADADARRAGNNL